MAHPDVTSRIWTSSGIPFDRGPGSPPVGWWNVQRQRSYEVDWRFISLWILNEENTQEWYTPEYRAGHYLGHKGFRIAMRSGSQPDRFRGSVVHRAGRRPPHRCASGRGPGRQRRVPVERCWTKQVPAAYLVVQPTMTIHDEWPPRRNRARLEPDRRDVGTPILTFRPGSDREGSFFGPVISQGTEGCRSRRASGTRSRSSRPAVSPN